MSVLRRVSPVPEGTEIALPCDTVASVDDSELARLEHENMVEAISLAGANADGALVRRDRGVAVIATGLPILLFNQVIVARADAMPDAVATAVGQLRVRGDRFVVNLRVGADDRYVPLMGELGLVPLSDKPWMPGMALHPIPAGGPEIAAGYDIREVTDADGVEEHIQTAAAGFDMPESILRGVMNLAMARHPAVAVYVGYFGEAPVATGLGVRTGPTIGVYNVSTVPAARRRGFGAAMTARIAVDGAAAGCEVAILQSSDMGYSVYERLGYRTVVKYNGYVEPASPESSDGHS